MTTFQPLLVLAFPSSTCKAELCCGPHDPTCPASSSCPSPEDLILRKPWGCPVLTTLNKPLQADATFFLLTFQLPTTLFRQHCISTHVHVERDETSSCSNTQVILSLPQSHTRLLGTAGFALNSLCGCYFEMKFGLKFTLTLYHWHRRLAL